MDFKNSITVDGNTTVGGIVLAGGTVSGSNINMNGFSVAVAPAKIYKTANQSISANTNTKITMGAIEIAPLASSVNLGLSRYIALSSGIYSVSGAIRCSGTNRSSKLMLYKNGAFYQSLQDNNTTAATFPFYGGSTIIELATNDYLELYIYASSSTTVVGVRDTFLSVHRIF